VFKTAREPVRALFENLEDGVTVNEFLTWFPRLSGCGATYAEVRGDGHCGNAKGLECVLAFRFRRRRTVLYLDASLEPELRRPNRLHEPGRMIGTCCANRLRNGMGNTVADA